MKIKFEIQLNEKWIRKEPEEYPVWFASYIGQVEGLTVANATLKEEEIMLLKIEINIDKSLVHEEPNSYFGFFNGFINQIAGLTVLKATLEEE